MAVPSNANKLISTKDNNYFLNNKITLGEEIPTTGTYKMGDIVINPWSVGTEIGWICTDDGEPGEWAALINGKLDNDTTVLWRNVMQKPSTFPPVIGTKATEAFAGDKGNVAYTHATSAHAPSNAQKNSDITKAEIEAKLTGSITSHNHDSRYYTETEIDTKVDDINTKISNVTGKLPVTFYKDDKGDIWFV